jgi:hypothetical protein
VHDPDPFAGASLLEPGKRVLADGHDQVATGTRPISSYSGCIRFLRSRLPWIDAPEDIELQSAGLEELVSRADET